VAISVNIGSWKWTTRALDVLDRGGALILMASGWRARRVCRHMPRLMSRTANPAIADMILLFGLNMVYYKAVSGAYRVRVVKVDSKRI
jgi:hypothetical protein